jgi:predicted DNA binding CopG/RHH family protein
VQRPRRSSSTNTASWYDFSGARKNPYAKRLKKQITIRLDEPTIEYFKGVAELSGIPYQTLINLYLRDCAQKGRKLSMDWRASA